MLYSYAVKNEDFSSKSEQPQAKLLAFCYKSPFAPTRSLIKPSLCCEGVIVNLRSSNIHRIDTLFSPVFIIIIGKSTQWVLFSIICGTIYRHSLGVFFVIFVKTRLK